MTIYDIPCIVKTAWPLTAIPTYILSGFSSTGICPFNRNIFTYNDFAPSYVTDRPDPALSASGRSEPATHGPSAPATPGPSAPAKPGPSAPATPGPSSNIAARGKVFSEGKLLSYGTTKVHECLIEAKEISYLLKKGDFMVG
ncbi:Hypothetical predicted protein [Octopus vulgaris]|uniref:Uncharacterized protein n=1 Tax=Octopus vulgaris TaxID=6645 RepID=A0AA36ATC0_OCTVU|nr:Hypothetical predicted protein [Octopus vulgaris]